MVPINVSQESVNEFWDYEIQQRTHMRAHLMDGGVLLEKITVDTEDSLDNLDFGFYDRVWFHENAGLDKQGLGFWISVLHRTGGDVLMDLEGKLLRRITNHCAKD